MPKESECKGPCPVLVVTNRKICSTKKKGIESDAPSDDLTGTS